MRYAVVYDILNDQGASGLWGPLFFGLALMVVVGAINWKQRLTRRVIPVAALIWVFLCSYLIYSQHLELSSCRRLLQTGAAKVVEGTVQDFVPMPYEGHRLESFVVSGVRFSFSGFDVLRVGFRHAESHGGPIHPGLAVRITYLGNSILRLEVAQPSSPPKNGA